MRSHKTDRRPPFRAAVPHVRAVPAPAVSAPPGTCEKRQLPAAPDLLNLGWGPAMCQVVQVTLMQVEV